jgi:Domain of unknown function (DUF4272)
MHQVNNLRILVVDWLRDQNIDASNALTTLPMSDYSFIANLDATTVARRVLCLQCIVACAFVPSRRSSVLRWSDDWRLTEYLTNNELSFLRGDDHLLAQSQWCVESIFALLWSVGRTERCFPNDLCPDNLVRCLPRISENQSPEKFIESTVLISADSLLFAAELYYVTHWLQRQGQIDGAPLKLKVESTVISFRRWAFEWLTAGENDWDQISLDT